MLDRESLSATTDHVIDVTTDQVSLEPVLTLFDANLVAKSAFSLVSTSAI